MTEAEKKKIENRILKLTETKRSDYGEPLWENDTFLSNVFWCEIESSAFFDVVDLVPKEKWNKLHIVHEAAANCLRAHNFIGLDYVYEHIPEEKWNDMRFCGFLVNIHHSAIQHVGMELKLKKEIFYVAAEAVPEIEGHDEFGYLLGYERILNEIPEPLWADGEFVEKIKEIIGKGYEGKKADFDLNDLLKIIEEREKPADPA